MLTKLKNILKNKYFIAILAFGVWMLFFDRNNVMQRYRLNRSLDQQLQEREFYLKEIEKDSLALHKLSTDTANLIRFARENYFMKKDNEDIFVIIEE